MIDQVYQAEINRTLDDQQHRTEGVRPPPMSTWQNFSAGLGGFIGGPLQGAGAYADLLHGDAQILAATGTQSAGGMFAVPSEAEEKQNDAARAQILTQGPDFDSATGAALRTRAKDFMPDPQTTGKAGVILGGLTNFAGQAIPAGFAGPPGLVALGTARGVEKSQELKEQGVDDATRMAAGVASGTLDAASMVAPLTGSTRLIAAGKGAAGGVGIGIAQTEAEKLILQHGGYDKLASTYDPFDPVSIALSGLVPAAFGALHSPTAVHAPGTARAEPTAADVTLSPAEQAHSDAVEASTIDTDIASLQREIAGQKDAASKQILQDELDRLTRRKAMGDAGAAPLDPNVEAAARVRQTADALDASRLTPDDDLVGREQHQQAVETASDQIARGEPVEVSDLVGNQPLDIDRANAMRDRLNDTSSMLPAADDEHIAQLEPAAQDQLRGMYADAAREKAGFDETLGRIADDVGGRAVTAPLKGTRRAVEKIGSDYNGDPSKAKDLLRATIEVDSAAAAQRAIAAIQEKYEVQPGHRNLLREGTEPLPGGYRDAKLNVSVNGHIAEIQVNLPEMLAAKKSAHKLYEESRTLRGEVDAQPYGEHSEAKMARIAVLDAKMREAYDAAWAEATKARNSDSPMGLPLRMAESELKARGGETSQAAEVGAPLTAAHETGIPSTSKNFAPDSNLAGKTDFMGASDTQSLHLDAVGRAADEILRSNPDLMVQLDGMDHPMRAADLLAAVREAAEGETRDASLLEVAAQCAISL